MLFNVCLNTFMLYIYTNVYLGLTGKCVQSRIEPKPICQLINCCNFGYTFYVTICLFSFDQLNIFV